ncbi:hypothetical protein ABT297_38195 [Dactylosporangium sp. NPDC000555]|uniref:hypothetical protein n=1 Tax=Dactylosporangium sp. NPDC000555 TaxID=3154260 RepID=UPI00331A0E91
MEPLTAITTLAAQYGLSRLIAAVGGDPNLAAMAAEIVSALWASEDRLDARLAGIESRLDEVLEQRYTVAIRSGLRTLVDAGRASDPRFREEELTRARERFVEATAAARTSLQVVIAERYLALCGFGLGRRDAARVAIERVQSIALKVFVESTDAYNNSLVTAAQRLDGNRKGSKRSAQLFTEQKAIAQAASDAIRLAFAALHESVVLSEDLGEPAPPTFVPHKSIANRNLGNLRVAGVERPVWSVTPVQAGVDTTIGPLSINFHVTPAGRHHLPPPQPSLTESLKQAWQTFYSGERPTEPEPEVTQCYSILTTVRTRLDLDFAVPVLLAGQHGWELSRNDRSHGADEYPEPILPAGTSQWQRRICFRSPRAQQNPQVSALIAGAFEIASPQSPPAGTLASDPRRRPRA